MWSCPLKLKAMKTPPAFSPPSAGSIRYSAYYVDTPFERGLASQFQPLEQSSEWPLTANSYGQLSRFASLQKAGMSPTVTG
jgi:hypothetical protein